MLKPLDSQPIEKPKIIKDKKPDPRKDYHNYRWFFTNRGKLVVGGKNDDQNELVMKYFLHPEYVVMHTSEPGSGFMIIQDEKPKKEDIEEAAIFCGCFSKQWKLGKKVIYVDIFKGSQIYKSKKMKIGTFGVMGDKKTKKIQPELVLVMQKNKLRAVPKTTKEKKLAKIIPGKMDKEKAAEMLAGIIKNKFNLPVTKQQVMQAIPSNNLDIKLYKK